MARTGDLERTVVTLAGFARAAPRHGDRPGLEVEGGQIGRGASERRARPPAPFGGGVERRPLIVRDAHPEAEHPSKQRVSVRRIRHGLRLGHRRHHPAPVVAAAAHVEQALDEDVVDLQSPVIAAVPVTRVAGRLHGRLAIQALCPVDVARCREREATQQRQARVFRQQLPRSAARRSCAAPRNPP